MGVDYYAKTILGVRVKNPICEVHTRGCTHLDSGINARFCPECGKPMWEKSKGLNPVLQDIDEVYENTDKLGIIHSTDGEEYFVGFFFRNTKSSRSSGSHISKIEITKSFLDMDATRKKLKEVLKDLYDEREFGLWTVLYCSY
jgi:hypothetical protein